MTPRFPRALAVALAAALMLPLGAVPALAQQNVGSLFSQLGIRLGGRGPHLVATVDREGQFHETQWLTLTTMWTDIVATAR